MRQTPDLDDFKLPQQHELPDDVIPIYGTDKDETREVSTAKLAYDILMLILLVIDLTLIAVDNILMSEFAGSIVSYLGAPDALSTYQNTYHLSVATVAGFFTIFWVADLSIRWLIAIKKRTYYRWFFFPFVHWYEVLGCFPALRAFRLLRAVVIIKRLHSLGIQVIPEQWLKSARFYYHILLEELSDRVILTAIDNFRAQLSHHQNHGELLHRTVSQNRHEIETALLTMLRTELTPRLQAALLAEQGAKLSADIGRAVEKALIDTPELRKYLKLIPIAGGMIESQITNVGKHIGENVTTAINAHLFNDETLDGLMQSVAHGVAQIDTSRPEVQILVTDIVEDVLIAFEQQVKEQQWKHAQQLPL
ncbi:hypothetical protein [uncultured Moraxella sp.]|uniref:hypothetical protein n=1 Tax=uncultured Moraxella sp. TaxID=263769 RepID=UPI0025F55624|nr:hypothetical protein [uncultured Moraxella sp.]